MKISGDRILVGKVAGIKENKSLKFTFKRQGFDWEGFVVKRGGKLFAYLNRCPHAGTTLDFGDNDFFTEDGKFLICRTHGAIFDPQGGICLAGSCVGKALDPFPVEITPKGHVYVNLTNITV